MASLRERGGRWLRDELPGLVATGVISEEAARALAVHYPETDSKRSRNLAFVLVATVGSALIAAGIILLVAHNWDELSRPLRCSIAFLLLIASQALCVFVLQRRDASQAWRESSAICNVATIGTVIAIVSQTYQIHGSFADFILIWMLLSLPLIYLLRTTIGACAYACGAMAWAVQHTDWRHERSPLAFWLVLLLLVPYCVKIVRRDRRAREASALVTVVSIAVAIGIGFTSDFAQTHLGALSLAGFFCLVYLFAIEFLGGVKNDRLHPLATLAAIGIGVMTIVLTFEEVWTHSHGAIESRDFAHLLAMIIQLAFPIAAIALVVWSFVRRRTHFSILAVALPIVTAIGCVVVDLCLPEQITWSRSRCDIVVALLFNVYALALGIELIARGLRADSASRTNFGLALIAALAIARFFDTDFSFVTRALGFIAIGLGFLATNFILLKKRRVA